MLPIEFNASVVNGVIQIPADLLTQVSGELHVILQSRSPKIAEDGPSIVKMAENNYFKRSVFVPLTRDEAHER